MKPCPFTHNYKMREEGRWREGEAGREGDGEMEREGWRERGGERERDPGNTNVSFEMKKEKLVQSAISH